MHVCGACGIRDPFDKCKQLALFKDLVDDHWLKVGVEAYDKLKQLVDLELLRPNGIGGYERVRIPRTLLHSLIEIEGIAYHVVPEAVIEDPLGQGIRLCKRCARGWDPKLQAKRLESSQDASTNFLEGLYALNAPSFTIAHGADFGRLSGLRNNGIGVDVSTLERLLLAEARCHHIVYKVVAYGDVTERKRLHGHSIICPQKAAGIEHSGFGKAALEATYAAVRIVFVGPTGTRQKLETSALQIEDFRLRPDVIYNFITINHVLHNGPCAPSIEEVLRLLVENSMTKYMKEHARIFEDTTIEKRTTPSDIANVRSHAQTSLYRQENEDPMEGTTDQGNVMQPMMTPVGLFELEPQQMEAVLKGIHRAVTEAEGGNGNDNPIADIPTLHADAGNIYMQRDDHLFSDYKGAADIVYKTWWSLMPLRRGLEKNVGVSEGKWRQIFLYFDNRFAHELSLLFHAANMIMRHSVNRAVSVRVKTNPVAFKKFAETVHDGDFMQKLEDAMADPEGKSAREVVARVIGYINLSASNVPWGSRERAAEAGKLIADHRYTGPDDVHNPTTIRWAMPYLGEASIPAIVTPEFLQALRGNQASERTALNEDGSVLHAMDETSLQLLAAKNPIACAITFDHLVQNMRKNLIGATNDRLKDTPVQERKKGVSFTPGLYIYPFYDSLCYHGLSYPGLLFCQAYMVLQYRLGTLRNATKEDQATYMGSTMVEQHLDLLQMSQKMMNSCHLF